MTEIVRPETREMFRPQSKGRQTNDINELRTSKENWMNPNRLKVNQVVPESLVPSVTPSPQVELQEQKVPVKPFFTDADKLSRLERYEDHDNHDPLNKLCIPYEDFKGPKPHRVSTDKYWIIIFCLIYIVLGVYTYFVVVGGKPTRLSSGMDFRGELCGVGGLKNLPYLYWANPQIDMNVAWCVHQCPPSNGIQICMYDVDHVTNTTFCYDQMQADLMGRYCIPKEPNNRAILISFYGSFNESIRKISSDLYLCWDIVLIFTGFCILLSYLFTVLATFKSVVGPLIWIAIWGSGGCFVLFGWLSWMEAQRTKAFRCIDGTNLSTCGGTQVLFFQVMTFVMVVLGAVYLTVIVILYRRINRGIELIKRAQHIIKVLSQIRMFPIILTFLGLIICSLFFWITINAMTIGDIELTRAKNISGDRLWKIFYTYYMQNMIIFAIFALIFTMTLLLVMNDMFTSYALSVWFFTKQKDTVLIPMSFVVRTLYRYHFGTCIFITFNLMFLSLPKMLVGYIRVFIYMREQLTLRSLPQSSNCVRYSQACCMGFIHIFETFLRYISKHTVVQVAIWSEPYYICAKKAYFLLFRNADKIKDLDFLQSLVVSQIQLCTALVASIPVYLYVTYVAQTPYGNNTSEIQMPIVPTAFVFFIAMFFTSLFQGSYDITCKTIIQLYLMDSEMFFGEQRFVEEFIREFMEFVGKAEDNEYKIGFAKQIKFDSEKLRKQLQNDEDGISQPDEKLESHNSEDEDEYEDDEEDKYSDQYINYDEQQERKNAFVGLPINEELKPTDKQIRKDHEELEPFTVQNKRVENFEASQLKLNTSQQTVKGLQKMGEVSMISDVSMTDNYSKPIKKSKF